MGCPLCGELTHKASTRLIRDTCGHIKCRLCLLKEENGCRICEEELKIDSIGSFNYPLPPSKSPNYDFPNCEPLELTINKIPINMEINDLPQSSEKEITVDENNLQSQNNNDPTKIIKNIQQMDVNNTTKEQNIENRNVSTSQITELAEIENSIDSNDFYDFNDDRALVIDEEREESTEDAHNNNLNKQDNHQNKNQNVDQIDTPLSSRVVQNLSQAINSRVATSGRFNHCIPVLQKSLEESEKLNSDLPNKRPKHLNQESRLVDSGVSPYRSPTVQLTDYLTINKLNEKAEASPLSFNFRSPFRLSDYIVFKDSSSQDEVTQRIEKDLNEGERKSGDYITSDGFLVQRVPAGSQSPTREAEDNLQINYFNETDTATDNTSPILKVPSYPILKKRFMSSRTISSNPKQNQNEMCDRKGTNSSPLKQMKKSKNGKKEDEDKENKKNKDKNKTTKKSTKVKSDTKTAALKKGNLPLKSKSKIVNGLKTKSNKRKKKEENNKLDDEPLAVRKGERKRRRKVLMYENEVLEVITKKRRNRSLSPKSDASPELVAAPERRPGRKRRKSKKDWSHVIRLPGVPARYRCSVCNATFGHWRGRNEHVACGQGEAPFNCELCDRTFYKRTHFQYHQRTHTGEKPYSCKLCGKGFVQKNKLNRHLIVHKQQRDIECDICGKKYQSKDYLKNHLLTHQGKAYKCSQCPKIFTLDFNRKRHEVSHSSEKPYSCDICPSKFKRKFLMKRHRSLHDKNRPFTCDHCGRGFLNKCAIRRHILSHIARQLEVKPFACDICTAKFRRQDNLKRHVKYHHTEDPTLSDVVLVDGSESDNQQLKISEPSIPKTPANEPKKLLEVEQPSTTEKEASVPDKAKNTTKPKRVSRTNSTTSNKSLPTSPKSNESINAVPISIRPTNSKLVFVDDIPREEALLLNQQIEMKLYEQKTFCNLPGLTRRGDLRRSGRERSKSNSNSDDCTVAKQNQETKSNDCLSNQEPCQKDSPYVHWRRRTAESLRSNLRKKL